MITGNHALRYARLGNHRTQKGMCHTRISSPSGSEKASGCAVVGGLQTARLAWPSNKSAFSDCRMAAAIRDSGIPGSVFHTIDPTGYFLDKCIVKIVAHSPWANKLPFPTPAQRAALQDEHSCKSNNIPERVRDRQTVNNLTLMR